MGDIDLRTKRYIKKLGLRCRELRSKQGLTLENAEERGTISWRYLQKIESGRNITIATLLELARIYKIDPSDILKNL